MKWLMLLVLALAMGVLMALAGCAKEEPPLPQVPNAPEDLSFWTVPELVQPPPPKEPYQLFHPKPRGVLCYAPGETYAPPSLWRATRIVHSDEPCGLWGGIGNPSTNSRRRPGKSAKAPTARATAPGGMCS